MLKYGTYDPVYGRESTKIQDCLGNCCGVRGAKCLCSSLVTKFESVFQTSQTQSFQNFININKVIGYLMLRYLTWSFVAFGNLFDQVH